MTTPGAANPDASCWRQFGIVRSSCRGRRWLVAGICARADAQAYPVHPVTVIVPFAAGGGNDILARLIAQHMGKALGQQFVIENRAGAGGTIGARAVAKAAPDGYTLMVGHSGVFGVAPALYADPGYEPQRDFAPVGLIASYQQILVVHPSVPVHSVARPHCAREERAGQDHLCDGRRRLRLPSLDRTVRSHGGHQADPRPLSRHRRDAGRSRSAAMSTCRSPPFRRCSGSCAAAACARSR